MRRLAGQTTSVALALLVVLSMAQPASAATGTLAPPIGLFTPERTGIGLSLGHPTHAPRQEIGTTKPLDVVA